MREDYINTGRSNQKQSTRDKILKSTHNFLKGGLDFSLEDVATKAGVSRATIYRYYSNVDVLASEASLDINTLSPAELLETLQGKSLKDTILGIQDYFNQLAIENENAFRKYLSFNLASASSKSTRGARREKALQLALKNTGFTTAKKNEMSHLFTLFMGIEPIIVAKDVSMLDNSQALDHLKKGLLLMMENFGID
ncbi:TetR/AcrR family transcriptional regulator [Hyunsoonleella sp. SJ7]|uniref:TetR/AcrR family transcriptional regulator n=1 Tax=Hyunsoonleella aquatilis TaxID=2762758 RepID=A0A923H7Z0_9FLAO|nr:TetR/AcrR family transcriptional regulator [Hyunsoonleella aquatilis]MBC3756784.1 TetR/AcrR family transcriptional regulator [Hyunsoonleella aquatilis]